ncbi:GxxExxY protein [Ramlibacter sp. PS3R-8]|uniref:GxxExxY protein n=1 Tax=Ramlibacter sp. PS3R-8 TaxID=3133437 RepID=UPI0030A07C8E
MKSQHPDAEGAEVTQKSQKEHPIENDCSHAIIGAAVEVQRVLGVGLLESAYSAALAIELGEREIGFQREVQLTGRYKGRDIGLTYRADFIVEQSVIVEVKAVDALADIHRAQVLSYLRLSGLKLGLLLNFNVFPVVKAIHRVVNKL